MNAGCWMLDTGKAPSPSIQHPASSIHFLRSQVMVSSGKSKNISYSVGDEVSYAFGSGIAYGEVVRLLEGGAAIEIQFEDGRREIKKSRDGALRLLRRASGASEIEENRSDRSRARDYEIDEVRRSDQRKR
jgi:hypothetical protein